MKRIITNLLLLASLSLCCSYCSCDPPVEGPTYYMSEEFKSYTVFPEGSYWIYEEVNTGMIDSVYLYRSEVQPPNGIKELGYDAEGLLTGYYSSFLNDSIRGGGGPDLRDQSMYVFTEMPFSSMPYMSIIFLESKPLGYELQYYQDVYLKYESFIETMTIQSIDFYEVKVFCHNVMLYSYLAERTYFSRNVGIIKRELFNGEVWELKRYYINN